MQKPAISIVPGYDIPAKPWKREALPRRILAVRLQALGDLVITIPYLQWLRNNLPADTRLDLLTRKEVEEIPRNLELFDKVYSIGGGRNVKKQFVHASFLLPSLWLRRYQVVLDLQNNILTHYIRKALNPVAWSVFDRFSPIAAGESTRLTIEAAGFSSCDADSHFQWKKQEDITGFLRKNGWNGESQLIVMNPAGAFSSRNWPMENYLSFGRQWMERFPGSQFLILGTDAMGDKANYLKSRFREKCIDLVNLTTPSQAFGIIQRCGFVLSEDSGLMHMAWVSGIPTLAIFGSTRSDRARPLGEHTAILHSGDLTCGNCMEEQCRFGDNHCLTRYSPEFVFEKAMGLIDKASSKNAKNTLLYLNN